MREGRYTRAVNSLIAQCQTYKKASALNPRVIIAILEIGELYYATNPLDSAEFYMKEYLSINPYSARGFDMKASIRLKHNELNKALEAKIASLQLRGSHITANDFLELSRLFQTAGYDHYYESMVALEDGIRNFENSFELIAEKISILAQNHEYTSAHRAIYTVLDQFAHKESWLVRKAELYIAEGDTTAAKVYLDRAKKSVYELPDQHPATPEIRSTREKINRLLKSLK